MFFVERNVHHGLLKSLRTSTVTGKLTQTSSFVMPWLCLHGLDSIFWRFAAVVSQRHQHLMLLLLVLVTTCGINYYTLLLHVVVSTSRSVAATYVLTTTSQQNHRIRQPSIVFILADDLGELTDCQ